MDRSTKILIRLKLPCLMLMCGAFVAQMVADRYAAKPMLSGLQSGIQWVSLGLIIVGSIWGAFAGWHLWRWKAGSVSAVCRCDGLLGQERSGRYGWYRRCLACNTPVNERHWR